MKKGLLLFLVSLFISNAYARIPYCPGTELTGKRDEALQYVIATFASEQRCEIGNNCLLNYDSVKFSVAWDKPCQKSADRSNDALGSTFICDNAFCHPEGFLRPGALY